MPSVLFRTTSYHPSPINGDSSAIFSHDNGSNQLYQSSFDYVEATSQISLPDTSLDAQERLSLATVTLFPPSNATKSLPTISHEGIPQISPPASSSPKYDGGRMDLKSSNGSSLRAPKSHSSLSSLVKSPNTRTKKKQKGKKNSQKRKKSKKPQYLSYIKPEKIMYASSFKSRSRVTSEYYSKSIDPISSTTKRVTTLSKRQTTPDRKERGHNISSSKDEKKSACNDDPCGLLIACHPIDDVNYTCICKDGTLSPPNKICQDIKVNHTPRAVTHAPNVPGPAPEWTFILSSVIFFLVLTFSVVFFCKRRKIFSILKNIKPEQHFEADDILTKMDPLNGMIANNPNYTNSDSSNRSVKLNSLSSHIISKDQIHIIGDLGEGCFGKVYKAEYGPKTHGIEEPRRLSPLPSEIGDELSWDKQIVAVKVLKRPFGKEGHEDFLREANIVSKFEHRNILSLIGIALTENLVPWMVFEYMPYGDLAEVLRSYDDFISYTAPKKTVNLTDLLDILVDIASGMEYLSQQHYVHRDLACRNCLVGEKLVVKISDFGMCRDVYTSDYYTVNGSPMVPVRWMPPESILYGKFTFESDVWSFGVVVWEVFSFAKQPYYGLTNEQAVKFILDGKLLKPPPNCPTHVLDVMRNCWKKQPDQRPSFEHILSILKSSKDLVFNNGEFPTLVEDVQYTWLSSSSSEIPVDSDEYLLPSPTHQREYLSFVSNLWEQNLPLKTTYETGLR